MTNNAMNTVASAAPITPTTPATSNNAMNTVTSATPATPATPVQSQVQPPKSATQTPPRANGANDAQSFMSDTATLCDSSTKASKKNLSSKQTQDASLPSSTAFAKTAKAQGWAAPTATRPSFGC